MYDANADDADAAKKKKALLNEARKLAEVVASNGKKPRTAEDNKKK
jgi:hypothetical protein